MEHGICDICGRAEILQSCTLCGKRVCSNCISGGICKVCMRGKFYEKEDSKIFKV